MTNQYDPEAEMQAIHKRVGEWFEAFVASPEYQRLTDVQKDEASGVVQFFTEYSFNHLGAAPERWNRKVVVECCTEILPVKVTAELPFFQAVAPVLSAFFDFLAVKGQLSRARELSQAVAKLSDEIAAASQNERKWGPAKAFLMAAQKAGVDPGDQQALDRYMVEFNSQRLARMPTQPAPYIPPPPPQPEAATPIRYSEPKPGRNDPCPCGSGKKFKKCCGA